MVKDLSGCLSNSSLGMHEMLLNYNWILTRRLVLCVWFSALIVLVSCTPIDMSVSAETTVLEMGVILDFEFSPTEMLVAMVVPEEAKEPGSPAFDTVILQEVFDNWQIVVYEVDTSSLRYESPLFSAADIGGITNLRWVGEESLLFLLWRDKTTFLVHWDLANDEWNQHEFGPRKFDLSSDITQIVAWDSQMEGATELVLFDYPRLQRQTTIRLDEIDIVSDVAWVENDAWILVGSARMNQVFRLEPGSEKLKLLMDVPRETLHMHIDADGELLLAEALTQWQIIDLGTQCVIERKEQIVDVADWSHTQDALYFVINNSEEKKQALVRHDIGDTYSLDTANCPNSASN